MHYSRPSRRRRPGSGFTLLEVVLGTLLLGTLLVAVLSATGAHGRKIRFAQRKLLATEFADQLLTQWHQGVDGIPLRATGSLGGGSQMIWRTHVVSSGLLCEVPIHLVRLEIAEATPAPAVLCHIDVTVRAAIERERP